MHCSHKTANWEIASPAQNLQIVIQKAVTYRSHFHFLCMDVHLDLCPPIDYSAMSVPLVIG